VEGGQLALRRLTIAGIHARILPFALWARTGFDLLDTPEAACRGRFVGLVNHRTKIKC